MPAPLLLTKLYLPPARPALVPRARLLQRLNEGLSGKLTLVSAPAGFGKTTLVSEWAASCGRPAAWLSLDVGDNDLARFLSYLVAALQSTAPQIGKETLAALQSAQPPAPETLLTPLLNEIATARNPILLVLDDAHLLESKAVNQALAFLVEHLPPPLHLVIAGREDPALPLARLRARGQLSELRAADLRFTPAEAADFLRRGMGLALSEEEIAALETRTEGWIAGLQLAAVSMRGRPDPAAFIQTFTGSHHFVLDYLVEEVLQQQPQSLQAFMLRSSILERMCAALCEAVTPERPGQPALEQLEHANLFITPLDDQRRWYRFHPLFADLLRQRLGQQLAPQEIRGLHLRASEWYEKNELLPDAFHHALSAADFERAACLAEDVWQSMDRAFQMAAWLGWVQKLPGAVVRARPRLCIQMGRAHSDLGDLEASEEWLQAAELRAAENPEPQTAGFYAGNIALVRANNAQNQGDLAETVRYTELAIQLLPPENTHLLAQAMITLGFTHWAEGDLAASLRAMQVWMEDMRRGDYPEYAVASAFAVADMLVIMGRLREAESTLQHAIQQAAALGPEAEPVTAHHQLGLALLAAERGDAAAQARHLQLAAVLGPRTTLVDWQTRWNTAQAGFMESAGEWEAALAHLDTAARAYVQNPLPIVQPIPARKARIYLKQGRLERAQAWARERALSTQAPARYLSEYELLTLARIRLAEGALDGVAELLERLAALAQAQQRSGSLIEILLTLALVYQARGNRPEALAALERALRLAEPEGYQRGFLEHGEGLRRLLADFCAAQAAAGALAPGGYAEKLLAAFSPPAPAAPQPPLPSQSPALSEPLSPRELEILRLIAAGRSNTEISQRLYLALSTVKGHNLRLFSKLEVQNRTQAVARARELGLL